MSSPQPLVRVSTPNTTAVSTITRINPEAFKWGVDRYDRLLCPGLQPGPPSQTPGGLGQRYWCVSEVTWPPQMELRRWRSSGPSSVMQRELRTPRVSATQQQQQPTSPLEARARSCDVPTAAYVTHYGAHSLNPQTRALPHSSPTESTLYQWSSPSFQAPPFIPTCDNIIYPLSGLKLGQFQITLTTIYNNGDHQPAQQTCITNDDRTQTMVQPPPLTWMTEDPGWHSEPASWMTTEPRPWYYLCYLPSLNLLWQPTKEPGQVIVASLQQNLLRHVAELGHLSGLTGQQIWRVHSITRWWEVGQWDSNTRHSRGSPRPSQGKSWVDVVFHVTPPAGSRSISATSGRSDSLPWINVDRWRDASPTRSQQFPEPPCIRPRCPYGHFPGDVERVTS